MKQKRRLVFLIIIAVLLIGIAVFAYIQRSNLNALIMSVQYSEEDLKTLQEQTKQELIEKIGLDPEILEQLDRQSASISESDPDVFSLTFPETYQDPAKADSSGAPVPSQVEQTTGNGNPPASAGDGAKPPNGEEPPVKIEKGRSNPGKQGADSGDPPKGTEKRTGKKDGLPKGTEKYPKDVQSLVYSLYSLQSQFTGRLEGIRASAIARFNALPEAEQTTSAQISIVKAGVSQALSLENQCDARVASLVQELKSTLRKHGMDESLAGSIENYYATQKGLVKAEYMRKYNKYLK